MDLEKLLAENLVGQPWLKDSIVYLTKHGSRAYGIHREDSDLDLKGIVIPPKEYFLGFANVFEQAEFSNKKDNLAKKDEIEGVAYCIRKFFKLASDCNPNIIEVLFADESDHIIVHPVMEEVLANRDLFLSKKARYTFAGYAHSQLKRIKNHRNFILNPPKAAPRRSEFGLPENRKLSTSQIGGIQNLLDADYELAEDVIALWHKEQAYLNAKKSYDSYMKWKANRNPERYALEEKYHYDVKHGAHLIRLLIMGKEILNGEGVKVKRPDAEYIKSIRNGALSYDEIIELSEKLEREIAGLYEVSTLRSSPPVNKLDDLLIHTIEKFYSQST